MNKKGELTLIALSVILVLFLGGLSLQLLKNDPNSITGNLMSDTERGCLAHPNECAAGTYCNFQTKLCTQKKDYDQICTQNMQCKSNNCKECKPNFEGMGFDWIDDDATARELYYCNGEKHCACNDNTNPCPTDKYCRNDWRVESIGDINENTVGYGGEIILGTSNARRFSSFCANKREIGARCEQGGSYPDKVCFSGYCKPYPDKSGKCATRLTAPSFSVSSTNKANGKACIADSQCTSKYCNSANNKCAPAPNKANGATCTANNQCRSKHCLNRKCVECTNNGDCGSQSACYENKCFKIGATLKGNSCTAYYNFGKPSQEAAANGLNDPHKVATAAGTGYSFSDTCINSTTLLQYYCGTKNGVPVITSQLTRCAALEDCKNGVCVSRVATPVVQEQIRNP